MEIAELLRAVAASYKLKNEDKYRFQIIAYDKAADSVEHASSELKDLWDEGKLDELAGIGKSISQHLGEVFKTGKSKHFAEVMSGLPPQIFDLMAIPGIGVKTAYKLVKGLNIKKDNSVKQLKEHAEIGNIGKLEGFGKDSETDILRSIKEVEGRPRRYLLPYAENISSDICEWIRNDPSVIRVDALGSIRRKVSTVGDIDISASSDKPLDVIEHFVKYPKTQRVIEKGKSSASIVITPDIQIDLMVQKPVSYGSLLQHFTGSKHHNIALREYALKRKLSLSEYGIRKIGKKGLDTFETEEDFYKALGLEWIPPEIREDNGEIEASLNQAEGKTPGLPNLVDVIDIKSDLQIHSNFNIETSHDIGLSSIEEIVDKANSLNYEYLALTEHNPSHSKHNKNEIIDILKRKKEAVDKINDSYVKSVKGSVRYVFNSLEIDILQNGVLPVSDLGMELLDFALVSIHSSFRLSRNIMTKRVLSALSHPKVKIFAHPTGRIIGKREGIELNWETIFDYCLKNNKFLEINADPMRLDLPDFLVKEAVKFGIKLDLGTDAHHIDLMDNMQYGVSVAIRGWATKKDIINCLSLTEFIKVLL